MKMKEGFIIKVEFNYDSLVKKMRTNKSATFTTEFSEPFMDYLMNNPNNAIVLGTGTYVNSNRRIYLYANSEKSVERVRHALEGKGCLSVTVKELEKVFG